MSTKKVQLSLKEIKAAFSGPNGGLVAPILSPTRLAEMMGLSVKTIYEWIAKGRLDGSFRKRGKHVLIWRDRAIDIVFNHKDWK